MHDFDDQELGEYDSYDEGDFADGEAMLRETLLDFAGSGLPLEQLYAFLATGRLVTPEARSQLSSEDLAAWDQAEREGRRLVARSGPALAASIADRLKAGLPLEVLYAELSTGLASAAQSDFTVADQRRWEQALAGYAERSRFF